MLIMTHGVQQLFAGYAPALEDKLHQRLAELPKDGEDDEIFSFTCEGKKVWAIHEPQDDSYTILLPEEY